MVGTVKIAFISNIICEPYIYSALHASFAEGGETVSYCSIQLEDFMTENATIPADVNYIVVLLNFEELWENEINRIFMIDAPNSEIIDAVHIKCQCIYSSIKRKSTSTMIWFGFEEMHKYGFAFGNCAFHGCLVDRLNCMVYDILGPGDIFVDLRMLVATVGVGFAYDIKNRFRWNSPYSQKLVAQICKEIYKQHLIHIGRTPKCIILDCDNVLWGGILSEDGAEAIELGSFGVGRKFQEFQRLLLYLFHHGVLLAICSKNDLCDVLSVFKEHSGMVLREENIAWFEVSWENKCDGICRIAEALNIGLESVVFVDDSSFEIEAVKRFLPEVKAIKYDYRNIYQDLQCFNLSYESNVEQIAQRNNTYKTNAQRKLLKASCDSFAEYLQALEMKVDIHKARSTEISRIAELSQRTNKCTNGKRYTRDELSECIRNEKYKLFSVFLSDRFSNLGLVGAVGINSSSLDLFSLSCRALGRNIEEMMFEIVRSSGVSHIQFISTGKNAKLYEALCAAMINSSMINYPKEL